MSFITIRMLGTGVPLALGLGQDKDNRLVLAECVYGKIGHCYIVLFRSARASVGVWVRTTGAARSRCSRSSETNVQS